MQFKLYGIALVLLTITTTCTDAFSCYTCTNATYVSECKSTTTCNAGEICFSDHIQTPHGMLYSFGCRAEVKCSSIIQDRNSAGSGSIVGRSASTGTCSECCKNQRCNRQLCQHSFSDKVCSDGTEIDCKSVGTVVNICTDTQHVKTVCERFCGLCDYADGSWSTWLTWSSCDVTCGTGTQTRIRKCTEPSPSAGGHDCAGMSQQTQTCTEESCPVHGGWGSWLSWGACSKTCGIGIQNRDRLCDNPHPDPLGDYCNGIPVESKICLPRACSDGAWSDWSRWSDCSESCDGGIRSKSRTCSNPAPSALGKQCEGSSETFSVCNKQTCPDKKVSFLAARLSTNGSVLVFPSVISNYGNGYNASTGRFTCKIPGVYYFAATLSKSWDSTPRVLCYLCLNSQKKIGTQQYPHSSDSYTDAYGLSISGTFHLNRNDAVNICICSGTAALEIDERTSFTGFLVTADN